MEKEYILDAAQAVDISQYDNWIKVGAGLKYEGFSVDDWIEVSQQDSKFKDGECEKKWRSFERSTGDIVTGGTIVELAKQNGWAPPIWSPRNTKDDEILNINEPWDFTLYDDNVTNCNPIKFANKQNWNATQDLIKYLTTNFDMTDKVEIVLKSYQNKDGKWIPEIIENGASQKTVEDIVTALEAGETPENIFWITPEEEAGAWIRVNPLDGTGSKDENVTSWNNALIECDSISIAEQYAKYRQFNLPIKTLTLSGGKSLHAVVRIDAENANQYKRRVNELYQFLTENGLQIDKNNKNPSRLTRVAGFTRKDNQQRLIETNIGAKSWKEWEQWHKAKQFQFPIECTDSADPYEKTAPELIQGVIRQGELLEIIGDSKMGKTWLSIQLALALASGGEWLGIKCEKTKVLYVNLELNSADFKNRIKSVADAGGYNRGYGDLSIVNARGNFYDLDAFLSGLAGMIKMRNEQYGMIILDPIYMLVDGDENKAEDVKELCRKVQTFFYEMKSAGLIVLHHSKGAQGSKEAIDRAVGSGVWGRFADAILDFSKLSNPNEEQEMEVPTFFYRCESILRSFKSMCDFDITFKFPIFERCEFQTDKAIAGSIEYATLANPKHQKKITVEKVREAISVLGDDATARGIADYLEVTHPAIYNFLKNTPTFYGERDGRKVIYKVAV